MASGLVRSAFVAAILLSGSLLVLYPVCGDNPSYTECRPHIDATIRDLAAKAIVAGEKPSEDLEHLEHAETPAAASAPEVIEPAPEPEKPVAEPATEAVPPPPEEPAVTEPPPPEPVVTESPEPEPVVVEPPAPEPVVVEPPAPEPVVVEPPAPEPVVVEPPAPEPVAAEPPAPEPVVAEPPAPEPVVAEPPTPEPVVVEPPTPEPVVAEPPTPEPVVVEPPAPEPAKAAEPPAPKAPEPEVPAALPVAAPAVVVEEAPAKTAAAAPPKTAQEPAPPAKEVPKAKPSVGFMNKLIYLLFGKSNTERDPKYAQPWQTHKEFKKAPSQAPAADAPKAKVSASGGIIDKFVTLLFGAPKGDRDPKWAQPWQTHKEHKKTEASEAPAVPKKIQSSGGILDKFISLLFGKPTNQRDTKWAEPWQSHKEHKKSAQAAPTEEVKVIHKPSGGIIDKLVKLLFRTVPDGATRDPKWAQPWQTHPEHARSPAPAVDKKTEEKKVVAGASGGLLDSLIRLIFPVPKDVARDPKWAKPWQTHAEHAKTKEAAAPEVKKVIVGPSGGIIDKLVKLIFRTVSADSKRDPKWAQPWQTHPEHARAPAAAVVPEKKKAVGASGGLLDSLIRLIFPSPSTVTKRDPKWAQPWQTHKGLGSRAAAPEAPAVQPKPAPAPEPKPAPVVVPEPVPTPKPEPVPVSKPEPVPAPKPEPASVPKPEVAPEPKPEPVPAPKPEAAPSPKPEVSPAPKPDPVAAPKPAPTPAPTPEPKPAAAAPVPKEPVKESAPAKATFPDEVAGARGAAKDAPAKDKPVVDAPKAPKEQVLEKAPKEEPVRETPPKEEEEKIVIVPSAIRSRDRLEAILGLDETSRDTAMRTDPIAEATLKDLKKIYETTIKPLETLYKYQDISNRHVSDAELFGKPLILLVGPYSTGKSTFLNYLMGVEYTKRALKTGTPPSHGVFRIIQYGETDRDLDGTDLSAHWSFASLQKYGQNFVDQLQGKAINCPLLKKVSFVEAPGILEMRRPGERLYPFNDVVQWFIDRADLILVMFDYTKLDAGYELEAILDQLKGREAQSRILLNKADQVPPEELIKVQGSLFWNLSPLLGVSTPPTVYAGSFTSRPYRPSSPAKLFEAQEDALLNDIAKAVDTRVDNRIAIARRHAVRVRNHAQMVDTYLTTFYKNKGFLTSKHKLAEDIIENPHTYNIYEGMSLLTNISRYDLPDPEIYRDFFRVHNMYDFQTLKETCTYFRGCPLQKIDSAISMELPELLERNRRLLEAALAAPGPQAVREAPVPAPAVSRSVPAATHAQTS